MFTHLLNLLLDPRLALVHATFDASDGPAAWANSLDDDLTLADLAAADEWSTETTEGAVLIVQKVGPGYYDIDIALDGFCVQRCYACGRLYPDIRFRVGWLLSQGRYDPGDYDCGCTDRFDEPAASPGGWRVWRLGARKPAELPAADPARTLTIVLTYDDTDAQPGWFVRVVEKPGCMSQGDTIAEALAMIADAIHAWDEAGEQ